MVLKIITGIIALAMMIAYVLPPAIKLKHVALAAVHACRRATSLPIVGMGGVRSGRDALELVACGASAVAVGTALFADPDAPRRIRLELDAELAARGLPSLGAARDLAHDPLPSMATIA